MPKRWDEKFNVEDDFHGDSDSDSLRKFLITLIPKVDIISFVANHDSFYVDLDPPFISMLIPVNC